MKKFKKLLAGFLSLAMAISVLPVMPLGVSAEESTTSDDNEYLFNYTFEDGESGDTSLIDGSNALFVPTITTVTEDDGETVTNKYLTVTTSGTVARGEMLYLNTNLTDSAAGVAMESGKAYEFGYSFRIEAPQSGASYSLFQSGMMYPNYVSGNVLMKSWNASGVNSFRLYNGSTSQGTFSTTDFIKIVEQYMPTGNENEFERTFFLYQKNSSGVYELKKEIVDSTLRTNMTAFKYWASYAYAKGTYEYKIHFDDIYGKELPLNTITFDANGGECDTASTTLLPGETTVDTSTLPVPTKDGYNFDGWYTKDGTDGDWGDLFDGNVSESMTLYAKWSSSASVTFIAKYQDGEDVVVLDLDESSDATSLTVVATGGAAEEPTVPEREGYTHIGWTETEWGEEADFANSDIDSAKTVYAVWQQEYTVTFMNGETEVQTGYTTLGKVTAPEAPETEDANYTFVGWFDSENNEFTEDTVVTEDTVYTAKFVRIHTLTFYINDGTDTEPTVVEVGYQETATAPEVGRLGYTLAGWNTEADGSGTDFDATAGVEANATYYAQWTKSEYLVRYTFEDGEEGDTSIVTGSENYVPTIESTLAEDGETVTNKYLKVTGTVAKNDAFNVLANIYDPDTGIPMEEGKAYEFAYKLRLDSANDNVFASNMMRMNSGSYTSYILSQASGAFRFFESTGNRWNYSILSDELFYKIVDKFVPDGDGTYTRIYQLYKETAPDTFEFIREATNEQVSRPDVKYWNNTAYNAGTYTMYLDDIYAKELAMNTINLDAGEGTVEKTSVSYLADKEIDVSTLPVPTREGYDFVEWQYDGNTFTGAVEQNIDGITLTAVWSQAFDITFIAKYQDGETVVELDLDEETDATSLTVTATDGVATEPTVPEREGYTLIGWTETEWGTEADFVNSGISENTTVYAVWQKEYTVTFVNGETEVQTGYTTLGKVTAPEIEAADGVTFIGWFDEAGNKYDENAVITADTTYTASFGTTYTVTFYKNEADDEEAYASVTGTAGSLTLPEDPTKTYYAFVGWYTDKAGTTEFDPDSFEGDISVYAKWSADLLMEDFDDGEYSSVFDSVDTARWTNNLVTIDGNRMMEYTRGETVNAKGGVTSNLLSGEFDSSGWYEYNYTIYPKGTAIHGSIMPLNLEEHYGRLSIDMGITTNKDGKITAINGTAPSTTLYIQNLDSISVNTRFNLHTDLITDETATEEVVYGNFTSAAYMCGEMTTSITYQTTSTDENGNEVVNTVIIPATTTAIPSYITQIVNNNSASVVATDVDIDEYLIYPVITEAVSGTLGGQETMQTGNTLYLDDVRFRGISETGTVSFVTNVEGQEIETMTAFGGAISYVPVVDDAGFDGWYTKNGIEDGDWGEEFVNKDISGDITLYAKILPAKTVYFYTTTEDITSGAEAFATASTTRENVAVPTEIPQNPPYIFAGWYLADEDGNPTETEFTGTNVTDGLIVVAAWKSDYFKQYFDEGADYEYTGFDIASGNTRWTNAPVTDEDGNTYMQYTLSDITDSASTQHSVAGVSINETLDMNGWYELGYKFDVDTDAYLTQIFTVNFKGETGTTTPFGFSQNSASTMTMTAGVDADGNAKQVSINRDMVDGFITVKYRFNLHAKGTPTFEVDETTGEVTANTNTGEAIAYISYINSETKEQVNETVYYHNISAGYTNNSQTQFYPSTKLASLSVTEYDIVKDGFTANVGDTIKIDDVYLVAQPDDVVITFDANGGAFADGSTFTAIADPNGVVADFAEIVPTVAYEDYTFAGWFFDEALTQPFTGTMAYSTTTVYARWQKTPNVAEPDNTTVKLTTLTPEMTIKFDTELDSTSVTKSTIKIMQGSAVLDPTAYELEYSLDENRNSVVNVKLNIKLDYAAEYTLVVTTGVKNGAGAMAEEWSKTYVTPKMKLTTSDWSVIDKADGSEITSAEAAGGKTVIIKYNISLDELN